MRTFGSVVLARVLVLRHPPVDQILRGRGSLAGVIKPPTIEDTPGAKPNTAKLLDLDDYDIVAVAFSGGKDSLACFLRLLDLGVPRDRIELWHHDVDGGEALMDWPITPGYVKAIGEAFGVRVVLSLREGGFKREMMRLDQPTGPVRYQLPDGSWCTLPGKLNAPKGTRRLFPQVSADLSVRWCSAYLKIDVARRIFTNDPRLQGKRILFVTGERRQESAGRSKYAEVELHASSKEFRWPASGPKSGRLIHQWRAVINWKEEQVWDIIQKHGVRPHPAYELGWGRVSCALCIFGDDDQWASARRLMPDRFRAVADLEKEFGKTIHRTLSIDERAEKGDVFPEVVEPRGMALRQLAMGDEYPTSMVFVDPAKWTMPAGAFKRAGGPT